MSYKENFKLIDWSVPLPEIKVPRHRGPRSGLACPMLIRDDLPDLIGQHDGKHYSSKSALRRSYKAHGLVEFGNDPPPIARPERPKVTKKEIAEAVQKVKQGYRPKVDNSPHPDLD